MVGVKTISLDLETYSDVDLSKCGLYRYVEGDFHILILAYAFDDEEVTVVDMAQGEQIPQEVLAAIDDPQVIKAAWNAQFERTCIGHYLGRRLSPDGWRCSMVHAASLSLPLALKNAAKVLKTGEQKDRAGENLIKYFSVPCKPTKSNGGRTRNLPEHNLEGWQQFKDYCAQDVRTERDIRKVLERFPMPDKEWDFYHMDQRINDRGVRIDTELVHQAIACDLMLSDEMSKRAYELTGLENPNSVSQLKSWLEDRGIEVESLGNGTLDLRTMEFREHRPEEFLTKVSPVVYDPEAVCPRWLSFMDEVMQGDTSRSRYLQKALGYSLSGDTRMECMFILYGATSRNGKGTTMESVLRILGEYGKNADPSLLSTKFGVQSSGGPSEEIARLAGSRFVNISEPEKKITLDAALTKRLTGNDTITARYLHENSFEFRPNFKVFINTNHLPNITDLTLFESGRIKIIPFNRHFDEAEQDKGLKALFAKPDNMSGIFNWLLEGWKLFEAEKLDMPQSVIDATAEYNRESDRVAQFVTTCLVEKEDGELANKAVFTRYQEWCRDNGYRPENIQHFTKALSRHCRIERKRPKAGGNKKTLVFGYEFAADEEPEVDFIPDEEPGSSGDSDAVRT